MLNIGRVGREIDFRFSLGKIAKSFFHILQGLTDDRQQVSVLEIDRSGRFEPQIRIYDQIADEDATSRERSQIVLRPKRTPNHPGLAPDLDGFYRRQRARGTVRNPLAICAIEANPRPVGQSVILKVGENETLQTCRTAGPKTTRYELIDIRTALLTQTRGDFAKKGKEKRI